jgi:hypothetical protein
MECPYCKVENRESCQAYQASQGQALLAMPEILPKFLQDTLTHHPDFIYFSGYASDRSPLLINLPVGSMSVANLPFAQMKPTPLGRFLL